MFNTMTVTKAAGALIGSLLFLMLVSWGASSLYHVGPPGHAGEGEEIAQAYSIEVQGGGSQEAEAEPEVDFATLLASADAAAGEKAFGKCRSCHKLDGSDGVGPHLNGVVGRAVGSVDGYNYSSAMAGHGGTWEVDLLQAFIASPKAEVPGTKMSFAGIARPQERADLIAYLQSTN